MHRHTSKSKLNLYFKLFVNPFASYKKSFKYTWWLQSSWLCTGVCERHAWNRIRKKDVGRKKERERKKERGRERESERNTVYREREREREREKERERKFKRLAFFVICRRRSRVTTNVTPAFAVAFVRADATSQSTSLDRTLAPPEMTFFRFFVFPHFVCLSVFSCKQNLSRYLSVQPWLYG